MRLSQTKARALSTELLVTKQICKTIDSPRALTIYLMIRHEEWSQLGDLGINPADYIDQQRFADDYLVSELLRKSPNLPLGIDRKKAALETFLSSEQYNEETERRLLASDYPPWVERFQRNVSSILGPLKPEQLDSFFAFGPGATLSTRGCGGVRSDKYRNEITLTSSLMQFVRPVMGPIWWEHQKGFRVVEHNKFTTVPKTAKTDRGICVPPSLNIYFQKGVAQCLRRSLRRFGIDLRYQADRNRSLVKNAFSDRLATIDLEAASDSVTCALVSLALAQQPRWLHLLKLGRCDYTLLPNGQMHRNRKFSAMGDGYTFELETLLFYALVVTFVPLAEQHLVSVFGDDIIVPQKYAEPLIDALDFLGFRVNPRKSFLAGSFFESCGVDYYEGMAVRPFHLKGPGDSGIPYEVVIANKIRKYSRIPGFGCISRFKNIWTALVETSKYRNCLVPPTHGGQGFIASREETTATRVNSGVEERFRVRLISIKEVERYSDDVFSYLSLLDSGFLERTRHREPVRGIFRKPRTRVRSVYWPDGGWTWL